MRISINQVKRMIGRNAVLPIVLKRWFALIEAAYNLRPVIVGETIIVEAPIYPLEARRPPREFAIHIAELLAKVKHEFDVEREAMRRKALWRTIRRNRWRRR